MSFDAKLLQLAESGAATRPMLRFYLWKRPTVSLGLNQVETEVVNRDKLIALGYGLVRRPTGGRALLHKGDLCYALVARREWHSEFRTLTSTYRAISVAIREALADLGVASESLAADSTERGRALNPCFAMHSPFEVAVGGRKICGSAQRRLRNGFLQHGSLRVSDSWTERDLQGIWPKSVRIPGELTTSLERELKAGIDPKQVAEKLASAFARVFQVGMVSNPGSIEPLLAGQRKL